MSYVTALFTGFSDGAAASQLAPVAKLASAFNTKLQAWIDAGEVLDRKIAEIRDTPTERLSRDTLKQVEAVRFDKLDHLRAGVTLAQERATTRTKMIESIVEAEESARLTVEAQLNKAVKKFADDKDFTVKPGEEVPFAALNLHAGYSAAVAVYDDIRQKRNALVNSSVHVDAHAALSRIKSELDRFVAHEIKPLVAAA